MSNHPICSWQRSPLFAAMVDALTECGLHDQAEVARITDPDVWARKGDTLWPTKDNALRARFHARWDALVHERCGIDPMEPVLARDLALNLLADGGEPEVVAETVGMHPDWVRTIGRRVGIRGDRSRAARRANTVRWTDTSESRARVVTLYTEDTSRSAADVARMVGLTSRAVRALLQRAGIERRPPQAANKRAEREQRKADAVHRLSLRVKEVRRVA